MLASRGMACKVPRCIERHFQAPMALVERGNSGLVRNGCSLPRSVLRQFSGAAHQERLCGNVRAALERRRIDGQLAMAASPCLAGGLGRVRDRTWCEIRHGWERRAGVLARMWSASVYSLHDESMRVDVACGLVPRAACALSECPSLWHWLVQACELCLASRHPHHSPVYICGI